MAMVIEWLCLRLCLHVAILYLEAMAMAIKHDSDSAPLSEILTVIIIVTVCSKKNLLQVVYSKEN